jgi:hypothetical protein
MFPARQVAIYEVHRQGPTIILMSMKNNWKSSILTTVPTKLQVEFKVMKR